jgi:hypothetical protein
MEWVYLLWRPHCKSFPPSPPPTLKQLSDMAAPANNTFTQDQDVFSVAYGEGRGTLNHTLRLLLMVICMRVHTRIGVHTYTAVNRHHAPQWPQRPCGLAELPAEPYLECLHQCVHQVCALPLRPPVT